MQYGPDQYRLNDTNCLCAFLPDLHPWSARHGQGWNRRQPIVTPTRTEAVPMAVTSDTLDYCKTLARKVHRTLRQSVAAPAPVVSQVMYLEREGEALCAHGHLRSGITQERRALVVLMRS